jgi:hypothetical protein
MQGIAAGVSEDAVCKTLHSSTARRYLKKQGFRWKGLTKGLYKDGHERQDVVDYRENKFLPLMAELKPKMVEFYLDQDLVCFCFESNFITRLVHSISSMKPPPRTPKSRPLPFQTTTRASSRHQLRHPDSPSSPNRKEKKKGTKEIPH